MSRPSASLLLAAACLAAATVAQAMTAADSGWVPVFNGKNFDGLYIRSGRAELRNPATQNQVRVEPDGSLYLTNPSPAGAICTKADLSYYHARIQYHFPSNSGTPNAGMLYHVDSLDWLESHAYGSSTADVVSSLQPSCGGSWFPKSWEAQMRRGQSGAIYGVANVWGETTAKGGKWDPAGEPHTLTPSYNSGPKNLNPSQGDWPDGPNDWVTLEVLVYGADSAIHVVNGVRVFKMTRLRHNRVMVPCGGGGGTWGTGAQLPMTNGKHCVQIEASNTTYRKWEMRPLPKDGKPTALPFLRPPSPAGSRYAVEAQRFAGRRLARLEAVAPPSHRGSMDLDILAPDGRKVRTFLLAGGSETVAWELDDAAGRPVPAGLYVIRVSAAGGSAARTFLVD